ncbi:Bax inhibitor-1/YccA family protein [Rhodovarius crocodyli]|uniref:Bax inhibitor-1/YccA family protein n=1 Tax=Rhodovarius crocodyli TaxID=1979269 RepID=A0A437MMT6_9PROT|nr:Bax inhibitor-1/YccA family protein [Rhodovarius crocodyli]RVT98943.1 Bax inhibitor-1/YccA family protein [Rhodovarius crocodyli]
MALQPDYRYGAAPGWGRASAADAASIDAGLRSYMLRVYNWMASGLLLTAIVAYAIASIPEVAQLFYTVVRTPRGIGVAPTILGWAAVFAPLAFVLVLSFGINRMNKTTAQALFWLFAAAMGASMSNIFVVYTKTSVASTFFATSGMFAAMSLWGYTTKSDLTRMGSIMMMGLFGIIIATLINIWLASPALAFAVSIIGVVVFCGLTAYDTQRIKADYVEYSYAEGTDEAAKRSVMDALGLYLNFVNLFQLMLQFMGVRNQD